MKWFKAYWLYKYFRFFSFRLVVNRGPLILDMSKVKELNFLDEKFAPFELDDVDLCSKGKLNWGTINRCRLGRFRSSVRTRLPHGSRISHNWTMAIATPKTSECIPASFTEMNHAQWIQLFFFRQCVSNQRL